MAAAWPRRRSPAASPRPWRRRRPGGRRRDSRRRSGARSFAPGAARHQPQQHGRQGEAEGEGADRVGDGRRDGAAPHGDPAQADHGEDRQAEREEPEHRATIAGASGSASLRGTAKRAWLTGKTGGKAMEFGIAMPTDAESWRLAERAEALGFPLRLVLRHPDAVGRLLRGDGRGGDEDEPIRLGTGVLDPVQPDRRGHRQCLRHAEQAGAGAGRYGPRHRLHRAARDGARRYR